MEIHCDSELSERAANVLVLGSKCLDFASVGGSHEREKAPFLRVQVVAKVLFELSPQATQLCLVIAAFER